MPSYTINPINNNNSNEDGYFKKIFNHRKFKPYSALSVLCALNLLNYVDRYTLAGKLDSLKIEMIIKGLIFHLFS
jgi:hypothetical protein